MLKDYSDIHELSTQTMLSNFQLFSSLLQSLLVEAAPFPKASDIL